MEEKITVKALKEAKVLMNSFATYEVQNCIIRYLDAAEMDSEVRNHLKQYMLEAVYEHINGELKKITEAVSWIEVVISHLEKEK